jgi:hypothetical protein
MPARLLDVGRHYENTFNIYVIAFYLTLPENLMHC